MEYPLLLMGVERGKLKVEKQGLYTLMEATAPEAEGLVRLWVQGGGREAYLGLMVPQNGGLRLRRRLSRLELSAFPENIERASDKRLEEDKVYITKEPEAWGLEEEEVKPGPEENLPEESGPGDGTTDMELPESLEQEKQKITEERKADDREAAEPPGESETEAADAPKAPGPEGRQLNSPEGGALSGGPARPASLSASGSPASPHRRQRLFTLCLLSAGAKGCIIKEKRQGVSCRADDRSDSKKT